jgi:hypothetical protein
MIPKGRFPRWLLVGLLIVSPPCPLKAGFCVEHNWTLAEIADAPVLVTARVVSLEMENGPHFTGDPKRSAPEQNMTAEVTVLRFIRKPDVTGPVPAGRLKIRFVGRDGPDFSFCARELPQIEPGQVLLLPLKANGNGPPEPWQLIGSDGYGVTIRVAEEMREAVPAASDGRSFLIRELVNSFRGSDPMAEFAAASLVATQANYLEPELSTRIRNALGGNTRRWGQLLASILVSYPGGNPLTLADVRAATTTPPWPRFQGFPQAQLALSHLPETAAEALVWRAVFAELPSLTDDPYHPLFAYNSSVALHTAVSYLSHYRDDPTFLKAVKAALREDRPGSSYLASRLMSEGQMACLPEALGRAMKVIRRPASNGDDVISAIRLVLEHGTDAQLREFSAVAGELKVRYPDYAAFLELKRLQESPRK